MKVIINELMEKNFEEYEHKETGFKVKACLFKPGMEDGSSVNAHGERQLHKAVHRTGNITNVIMHNTVWLVKHDEYLFAFQSKFFFDKYRRVD